MPPFGKIVEMLIKRAKEKGANSVKLIPTRDIFVEDYVRQKCRYGCEKFARCFTCPPYAPTPDETRKTLKNYNQGLLIEFTGLREIEAGKRGRTIRDKEEKRDVHEIMFELEKEAFLNGLYKAFAYAAGPCKICAICPAEKAENSNEFSKKDCKNPLKASPSMEASGIDVYRTARKAGYKINVVKEGERFTSFGLLLLK